MPQPLPLRIVIWEVTRACELVCLHCRAEAQRERHPQELSTEEGLALLEQLARMRPRPLLILTGGDPLMRPDIFDLVSYASSLGLRASMAPSATSLITYEALKRLRDAGLGRIAFSLDGAREEVHDGIRGVRGSFALTLKAIRMAKRLGIPLQIGTTVMKGNEGELEGLAGLMEELGAVLWNLFFLVPTGRATKERMLSPQDHEAILNWLYDLALRAPYLIKTTAAPHYRRVILERSLREGREPPYPLKGSLSYATSINEGKGFCFISHRGEVMPSGFLPIAAGSVRDAPLQQLYERSGLFLALNDPDRLKGRCGICKYRWICGGSRGRAYAVYGDYLAEEPCCAYRPEEEGGKSPNPTFSSFTKDLAAGWGVDRIG